jgi:predicted Fe-S protein YdhL (DUF1289 family)
MMKTRLFALVLIGSVAACPPASAHAASVEVRLAPAPSLKRGADSNVYGWQLMTHEERAAVQARLRAARTPEEADRIRRENHAAMQARARERGVSLPPPPARDCSGSPNGARSAALECRQGGAP